MGAPGTGSPVRRLVGGVITAWAILGGVLLLAVVAINVAAVVGGIAGLPLQGDFELTEMGVAVAVFAFLPYCELTGANVSADIFTTRLKPRARAGLALMGSLAAFVFSLVLLWRMSAGAIDQRAYNYTTAILQVPVWVAFIPILVSLALLALAALFTLGAHAREAGRAHV
ncbi:TRAP transporter small permease [Acuticoccus sp. MNP-M23]|uniref:TRAP transporter small permease n=1 Tax=Acuticoccus sp. MNP-M23 TaxID=3072793 RepID=UPI002814C65C|nr:TRAP transporter small permease [Acuticoccus sp. MNP-M23]WMS43522.1 TRAP transporter small permease [Acuticoccus sp. MNP-M23]